jgi:hypothetical protein
MSGRLPTVVHDLLRRRAGIAPAGRILPTSLTREGAPPLGRIH